MLLFRSKKHLLFRSQLLFPAFEEVPCETNSRIDNLKLKILLNLDKFFPNLESINIRNLGGMKLHRVFFYQTLIKSNNRKLCVD